MKASFAELLEKKGVTLSRKNAFAAIVDPGFSRFKDPVLVLKSEEPGSKQLFAFENDRVESVCFDRINHLVNDCICCGAEPVAIQDVIVCGMLEGEIVKHIMIAISERRSSRAASFREVKQPNSRTYFRGVDTYFLPASSVSSRERRLLKQVHRRK